MPTPTLIAEISSNHNMQLPRALDLISAAADAGATHAKFQAWEANAFYSTAHAALHARARQNQIPEQWWHSLAMHCQRRGIAFLCTPFDIASLDTINPYVDQIKVASGDLTNTQLLRYAAAKGKPVILSTGAATIPEIETAVSTLSLGGAATVTLLHCVSAYPPLLEQVNLRAIPVLAGHFGALDVGYSDHTANIFVCLAAHTLGAQMLEVHFDLADGKGAETNHSLEPRDLCALVKGIEAIDCGTDPLLPIGTWQWHWPTVWDAAFRAVVPALGDGVKRPMPCEVAERDWARRGIYTSRAVRRGQPLAQALVPLRPAWGVDGAPRPMPADQWDVAVNGIAARDMRAGEPVGERDVVMGSDK